MFEFCSFQNLDLLDPQDVELNTAQCLVQDPPYFVLNAAQDPDPDPDPDPQYLVLKAAQYLDLDPVHFLRILIIFFPF